MKRLYWGLLVLAAVIFVCAARQKDARPPAAASSSERIVSLSPNITETLFALGLGERVVGVTRFCRYPPEAAARTQVGGYLDINYEAVAALRPDLVLLLPEHEKMRSFLGQMGISHITLKNRTIADIMDCITSIGKACGAQDQAIELSRELRARMKRARDAHRGREPRRVLVVVSRSLGTGIVDRVHVAGSNTFYEELIQVAGGCNACEVKAPDYPVLSAEGIWHMDPEIILDLVPDLAERGVNEEIVRKDWDSLPNLDAVREGRVHVLCQEYVAVPGPRFALLLEDISEILKAAEDAQRPQR